MASAEPAIVRIGAIELRFHVDETHGSGDAVVFEFIVPPGARVPAAHHHEAVDEFVYGLDGTLTTTVDGRVRAVRRGDSVRIPRGSVHLHENKHDETARVLVMLNPGKIGRRYFEETAAVVNAGKPDPVVIKEIMNRHGLVPA